MGIGEYIKGSLRRKWEIHKAEREAYDTAYQAQRIHELKKKAVRDAANNTKKGGALASSILGLSKKIRLGPDTRLWK